MNITNTELNAYITTLRSDLRKAKCAIDTSKTYKRREPCISNTLSFVEHQNKYLNDANNHIYHALRVLDMITEQMEYNEEWD